MFTNLLNARLAPARPGLGGTPTARGLARRLAGGAPARPGLGGTPTARGLARRLAGSSLLEALTAPHGVDRYLELVLPSLSLHDLRAEVLDVRRPTPRSATLRLRPNSLWRGFHAGQFVSLTVEIDGVRRTRCYSPASSQYAPRGELELTVRAHDHGLVSQYLYEEAHPGMVVELAQADGDFTLPASRPERLLLISGGSGITPVMSMLRTLCEESHGGPVMFLHYAPRERDIPYRSELEELAARHPNVRVAYVCTRESGGGPRGRLTRAQLRALEPSHLESEVYVCGPPSLIAATRTLWSHEGLQERVHSESFLPPRLPAKTGESGGSVRFAASGIEIAADGGTLLEQAEQAGLSPAYGCRMGICHTCTCRKLTGAVRNLNSGELSSGEEQEIQICVSVPAGDVELDL
jgi:stearoyl-CoA 9-desaturase NADPH oxidoreductase